MSRILLLHPAHISQYSVLSNHSPRLSTHSWTSASHCSPPVTSAIAFAAEFPVSDDQHRIPKT
ncbi:MAG TPA: hypothetical protein H9695_01845, partial [Candidatus Mediterraneibacter excrementigallinarum]|nr:hypothetical protein [Candidatus Mediterraneibacter excrementigallinarum]